MRAFGRRARASLYINKSPNFQFRERILSAGKKSLSLLFLIYVLVLFFCFIFRFFIFYNLFAFLGCTTALSTCFYFMSSGANESANSGGESGEIPPLESSSSPGAPPRSASLEGHASSSESAPGDTSSQFTSAATSPSPSIPGNQSVESSPNAEQKESLHFLSEDQLLNFWKKEAIRAFHEGLETVDPQGNIGRIPEI